MKNPVGEELEQKNTLEICHTAAGKLSTKVLFSSQQVCWKCASCVKFKVSHDKPVRKMLLGVWCMLSKKIANSSRLSQQVWSEFRDAEIIKDYLANESIGIFESPLCTTHYVRFKGYDVE